MTDTFEVIEVFRLPRYDGPVLVGRLTTDSIAIGDRLVSTANPSETLEVIGVGLHTSADGSRSLIVRPDLGAGLEAGTTFVVAPRDIAQP